MHIPKDTVISNAPHEMIALIGAPGTGKTTSCLTFPNRIFGDFDHKLPVGEQSIPFWSPDWVKSTGVKNTYANVINHRDAIKRWMEINCPSFTEEQTYIHDSWTMHQGFFDRQTWAEDDAMATKNAYWFWKQKGRYAQEIMDLLKSMRCRVVVTFHETNERDEDGQLTGKIKPVMDGGFKDKILGYFTDVWRQVHDPYVLDANGRRARDSQGKALVKQGWFWQLVGDTQVDCNMNPTLGAKVRQLGINSVPADYANIQAIYDGTYKIS